jgi:hypothetical protein
VPGLPQGCCTPEAEGVMTHRASSRDRLPSTRVPRGHGRPALLARQRRVALAHTAAGRCGRTRPKGLAVVALVLAARLTESGPRWPFSRRCLIESGPHGRSLGGVAPIWLRPDELLGGPPRPAAGSGTRGAASRAPLRLRLVAPRSAQAGRSGRSEPPAWLAAIVACGGPAGSPPGSRPDASTTATGKHLPSGVGHRRIPRR